MPQPTLHLMVGLPGSGKTTLAKKISREENAIRLTPDEWQLRLFGDDTDHPEHDHRHGEIEAIMWELAVELLKTGTSVILDYGFWAVEERQYFYEQAKRLGVLFRVHFLDVPQGELLRRISSRNNNALEPAFTILPSHMEQWTRVFQPVSEQEAERYADLAPRAQNEQHAQQTPNIPGLKIREEAPKDYRSTEELVREAFWNRYAPGATEHYVLHLLRQEPVFEPWHSLVAEYEHQLIGQVLLSPANILDENGEPHRVMILGPVCCLGAVSGRGVGSALMEAAVVLAREKGERAIFLMGNPRYYTRFGFVPASSFGVHLPGMDVKEEAAFFMALPLYEGALEGVSGVFHESPAFVQAEGFETYDNAFPKKQKMKLPGQLHG